MHTFTHTHIRVEINLFRAKHAGKNVEKIRKQYEKNPAFSATNAFDAALMHTKSIERPRENRTTNVIEMKIRHTHTLARERVSR